MLTLHITEYKQWADPRLGMHSPDWSSIPRPGYSSLCSSRQWTLLIVYKNSWGISSVFLSIIQFAAQQPRTFRLVSQPRTHKLPLSEQGTEAAELKSENEVSAFIRWLCLCFVLPPTPCSNYCNRLCLAKHNAWHGMSGLYKRHLINKLGL